MAQKDIEMILMRQLASCLASPVLLVDSQGDLAFYNGPAEAILGMHFADTGPMPGSEWGALFSPLDEQGNALPVDAMPVVAALKERIPKQRRMRIRGLDGVHRLIEATGVPLIGHDKEITGAVSFFREVSA